MDIINIIAVLVTLAAVLSYINHRLLKLSTTIGLMLLTLVVVAAAADASYFGC